MPFRRAPNCATPPTTPRSIARTAAPAKPELPEQRRDPAPESGVAGGSLPGVGQATLPARVLVQNAGTASGGERANQGRGGANFMEVFRIAMQERRRRVRDSQET